MCRKSTVGRAMGVMRILIRVRRKRPDRLGDDSTVVLEVGKALEAGTMGGAATKGVRGGANR